MPYTPISRKPKTVEIDKSLLYVSKASLEAEVRKALYWYLEKRTLEELEFERECIDAEIKRRNTKTDR